MKNTRKIIKSPSIWTQELATEHKLNEFLHQSLLTSRSRLSNFMRRSKFSFKRPTTTVQTMPKDGLEKIANIVKSTYIYLFLLEILLPWSRHQVGLICKIKQLLKDEA